MKNSITICQMNFELKNAHKKKKKKTVPKLNWKDSDFIFHSHSFFQTIFIYLFIHSKHIMISLLALIPIFSFFSFFYQFIYSTPSTWASFPLASRTATEKKKKEGNSKPAVLVELQANRTEMHEPMYLSIYLRHKHLGKD